MYDPAQIARYINILEDEGDHRGEKWGIVVKGGCIKSPCDIIQPLNIPLTVLIMYM